MAKKSKASFITEVYQLPRDDEARKKFTNGIKALADECQATWVAGSVSNEMDYVEMLENELSERYGQAFVEDLRQKFESQ